MTTTYDLTDTREATVVQALTEARALLNDPGRWMQGEFAGDQNGRRVRNPLAPEAVAFCLLGACYRVVGFAVPTIDDRNPFERPALVQAIEQRLEHAIATDDVPDFNDDEAREHADILAALDAAIAGTSL